MKHQHYHVPLTFNSVREDSLKFVQPCVTRGSKYAGLAQAILDLPPGKVITLRVPAGALGEDYASNIRNGVLRQIQKLSGNKMLRASVRLTEDSDSIALRLLMESERRRSYPSERRSPKSHRRAS